MEHSIWLWGGFILFVVVMLVLDLGIFNRKNHEMKVKEALLWSLFWIGLALLFNAGIYIFMDHELALQFLAGYLLEKSLSIDNLFVFLLIFGMFQVDPKYQHKALFWGIIGALLFRAIFIFAGVVIIQKFHWVIYLFGVFLIFTGIKMIFDKGEKINPENNILIKVLKKIMPVSDRFHGGKFLTRINMKLYATPLLVVLVLIEFSDLVFAIDSIPAILAISNDPFIVYTSNVFAILGLRSLYFALAGILNLFRYLKFGLSAILIFVGIKMTFSDWFHISTLTSLFVILFLLAVSILASVLFKPQSTRKIS